MTEDERISAEIEADRRAIAHRRRVATKLEVADEGAEAAIRRMHSRGESMAQLARDSGLSILTVRMICRPEVRQAHNERRRKPEA